MYLQTNGTSVTIQAHCVPVVTYFFFMIILAKHL
jgi:hypothetical protein